NLTDNWRYLYTSTDCRCSMLFLSTLRRTQRASTGGNSGCHTPNTSFFLASFRHSFPSLLTSNERGTARSAQQSLRLTTLTELKRCTEPRSISNHGWLCSWVWKKKFGLSTHFCAGDRQPAG